MTSCAGHAGGADRLLLPGPKRVSFDQANATPAIRLRRIKPLHLLIVDDEKDFRDSLALLLQAVGHSSIEASSGDEALALLEKGVSPDVVLLDHRMPGLTGVETLAAMRRRGVDAPVLLVSAARDVETLASEHGFDGAVAKPFSVDTLCDALMAVSAR